MTVSLVPRPSPPPVLSLQYEKTGRRPGVSYHVVCSSTDELQVLDLDAEIYFHNTRPFCLVGKGVFIQPCPQAPPKIWERVWSHLQKSPYVLCQQSSCDQAPFPIFGWGLGTRLVFISQQGGSYKRSTLVMMIAVAIRKTGVISGCALGNQPVSMTNFDNGATCITSGDKRWPV